MKKLYESKYVYPSKVSSDQTDLWSQMMLPMCIIEYRDWVEKDFTPMFWGEKKIRVLESVILLYSMEGDFT